MLEKERPGISPKIFLITGAANGMGHSTVESLSRDPQILIYALDFDPVIYDIYPPDIYPHVTPILFDVRNRTQAREFVNKIISTQGKIDGLFNIAGIINRGRRETYWENGKLSPLALDLLATNFAGPLYLIEAVLPFMRRGKNGLIVNVSTTKYANSDPYSKLYEDTKGLLSVATQNLRIREAANGIRVVEVQPGIHNTGLDKNTWTPSSDRIEMHTAQLLYDLVRVHIGSDPHRVGQLIKQIAEGNIDADRCVLGRDAQISVFLYEHLPYWKELFGIIYLGAFALFKPKVAMVLADDFNERLEKYFAWYAPLFNMMDKLFRSEEKLS